MRMNMPSAYERKRGRQFPYGVPITSSSSCIGLVDASVYTLPPAYAELHFGSVLARAWRRRPL
jgi:hypothetical protein